ncbi:MAG TPA: glycosyltransferase [Candidatus Competibacteraceae bacterium]|nr:glycosyltransferase [Candidatus Competibacteraceae bacterium]
MMRVLHLRSSAGFFGAERVLTTLLAALPGHGVAPLLVTVQNYRSGDRALLEAAQGAGIATLELPCGGRLSPRTLRQLLQVAREQGMQCIHTHDYKSHAYGWLAARRLGLPLVATLHGWISIDARLRLYQRVERLLLGGYDAVVTVSPSMSEQVRRWQPRRLYTIANGVDTELFHPRRPALGRERWGLAAEHFLFGTVARLSPEKGQWLLLEAFARIVPHQPRARLLLVGEGPQRAALEQTVRHLGLEGRVVFAGQQGAIEHLLHDLDCYVSPSLTEGMPMIILEAMASGVPVIASRVGALPEMLADEAGVLVPAGDAAALAEAMAAALASRLDLAAMAERAHRRCLERYSVVRQASAYAEVYADVRR